MVFRQERITEVLEPLFGKKILFSPDSIKHKFKDLDDEVKKFHQRPLEDKYIYLFLDGIYLSKKKAIGAKMGQYLLLMG